MSGHRQQAAPPTGDRPLRHASERLSDGQGSRHASNNTGDGRRKHHRQKHYHSKSHRPHKHAHGTTHDYRHKATHQPAHKHKADSCPPGSSAAARSGPALGHPGLAAATNTGTSTSRAAAHPAASHINIYSRQPPPTKRSLHSSYVPASHSFSSSSVSVSDPRPLLSLSHPHSHAVPERSRQRPLALSAELSPKPTYPDSHTYPALSSSPSSSYVSPKKHQRPASPSLRTSNSSNSHNPPPPNMVSGGRVICVALPFVLAVASIVTLLAAAFAGVAHKNTYMFRVNTTDLTINPSSLSSLLSTRASVVHAAGGVAGVGRRNAVPIKKRDFTFHDPSFLKETSTTTTTTSSSTSSNITASELGLGLVYDINLWGYCETQQNGTRTCTKPEFDWATKAFNQSEHTITSLISSSGVNITLPTDVTDALTAFSALTRWTEIVFVIGFVALALEIVVGLFTSCSRIISCLTFVVAGLTSIIVVGAAAMSTALGVLVVGTVEATAKWYGVSASFNTAFLTVVWISAAFAVAASFFWMFSICCCKPESRRARAPSAVGGKRDFSDKHAKTGSYQPLNDPNESGYYNNAYAPQYGPRAPAAARSDLAYEPYSHSRT